MKEFKAATMIQSHARRVNSRNKFFWLQAARQAAAKRIQKAWRRSRNKNDITNVIRAYKNMNATRV